MHPNTGTRPPRHRRQPQLPCNQPTQGGHGRPSPPRHRSPRPEPTERDPSRTTSRPFLACNAINACPDCTASTARIPSGADPPHHPGQPPPPRPHRQPGPRTTPPPANLATSHHPSPRLPAAPSITRRTHLIDVLSASFVSQLLGFPMTPKAAVSASLPSPPLPASRAMPTTHPRRAWLALPP